MARISDICIKQEATHYTLTQRKTLHFMTEYADFAQEAMSHTADRLATLDLFPLSGPIVCFHNTDLDQLDVEVGWQILSPVTTEAGFLCQSVPARKIATTIDQGPYEEQDATLMDLLAWIQEKGRTPAGPIIYCYLNDTERPALQYLTQMLLPVV